MSFLKIIAQLLAFPKGGPRQIKKEFYNFFVNKIREIFMSVISSFRKR